MSKTESSVVIVESPAKASTIERYLGKDFKVLASYGHIRDLLSKSGSVDTENDFKMTWAETERSKKHIDDILKAVKSSDKVFLATDPDREGEAIAWHISEIIKDKYQNKTPDMYRVVFHEITKDAVTSAMKSPKKIDNLLVDAYLARRALDYLVGYSLSPILWQKLPGSRSAGRVQSVALRLIVEREQEIEKFNPQEYWTIDGLFNYKSQEFKAKLHSFDNKKLSKLDISNADQAKHICSLLENYSYKISSVEKKQVQKHPFMPFTTSTLQQDAFKKLGFGASRTMRVAQGLYEGVKIDGELTGLITYMRTDSVNLSKEAISGFRDFIKNNYGDKYLPDEPRIYKTKSKNAQEAHEAIRPTNIMRKPEDVAKFLSDDQLALYTLIWKRSIASQMESALFDQVTADISDESLKNIFRAVGTTQVFDGFLKIYQEGKDESEDEKEENSKLPVLEQNAIVDLNKLIDAQHFTKPPARFTEASLVKKLEELGIGRPSTYAPLMQVLQDRGYASIEKRQFVPSDRGRVVTSFLTHFCKKYVEYDFTASMEDELDQISNGDLEWKNVMHNFWNDFSAAIKQMKNISITEVIDKLEEDLSAYIFKDISDRTCDKCNNGIIGLKLSKFGAFLGCSNYPECQNRKKIGLDIDSKDDGFESVDLGVDESDGAKVSLKKGPYGFYVQFDLQESKPLDEAPKKGRKKTSNTKRVGLPPNMSHEDMNLEKALLLKSLPKIIGEYDGSNVQVNTGRFGPYVKCGEVIASIPKSIDFLNINLDEAINLIEIKKSKPAKKKTTKLPHKR